MREEMQATLELQSLAADAIESAIRPQGVGVVVEARHLCMMMRGVEKQHSALASGATGGD